MSVSCTEPCPVCSGTGTGESRHPVSGRVTGEVDCARCNGSGSVSWEVS